MTFTISYCKCPKCGNKFPIPRQNNRKRERGHHKWIYCPICLEKTNMLEIREGDYGTETV
jgi:hypothetical protein